MSSSLSIMQEKGILDNEKNITEWLQLTRMAHFHSFELQEYDAIIMSDVLEL